MADDDDDDDEMPNLTDDQFRQLFNGVRGGRNPKLETTQPSDWRTFEKQFLLTAANKEWTDQKKRQELFLCMEGEAAQVVRDIDCFPANPGADLFDGVLARYRERFLTAPASQLARLDFRNAKQGDDQTALAWHGALRDLFLSAHPGEEVDGPHGQELRETFIWGLKEPEDRSLIWERAPATYAECLTAAQTRESTREMIRATQPEAAGAAAPATGRVAEGHILAISEGCFECGQTGHYRKECQFPWDAIKLMSRYKLQNLESLMDYARRNNGDAPNAHSRFGASRNSGRNQRGSHQRKANGRQDVKARRGRPPSGYNRGDGRVQTISAEEPQEDPNDGGDEDQEYDAPSATEAEN